MAPSHRVLLVLALASCGLLSGSLAAQTAPPQAPTTPQQTTAAAPRFAVVSIKESGQSETPDLSTAMSGHAIPGVLPHGVYRINHWFLYNILVTAYLKDMKSCPTPQCIVGLPAWAGAQGQPAANRFFDIDARPDSGFPDLPYLQNLDEVRLMLQAMLADRFQLKLHRETHTIDGYRLEVAPGGPKNLVPAVVNAAGMAVDPSFGPGEFVPEWTTQAGSNRDSWSFGSPAISMQGLADELTHWLFQAPVLDATGIQGLYSMRVAWDPQGNVGRGTSTLDLPPALEREYGLRLVSAKVPVQVLVVDSVSLPTPN